MKKILSLLFIVFQLISCNNDEPDNQISIVGTWKPVKTVLLCDNNDSHESYPQNECQYESRVIFYENGENSVNWKDIDNNGDCITWSQSSGTWEIENDNLILRYAGETEIFDYFEYSENILKIGTFDIEPGSTCENPTYYYNELEKVN